MNDRPANFLISLLENIIDCDHNSVNEDQDLVLHACQLHEFIRALPEGVQSICPKGRINVIGFMSTCLQRYRLEPIETAVTIDRPSVSNITSRARAFYTLEHVVAMIWEALALRTSQYLRQRMIASSSCSNSDFDFPTGLKRIPNGWSTEAWDDVARTLCSYLHDGDDMLVALDPDACYEKIELQCACAFSVAVSRDLLSRHMVPIFTFPGAPNIFFAKTMLRTVTMQEVVGKSLSVERRPVCTSTNESYSKSHATNLE